MWSMMVSSLSLHKVLCFIQITYCSCNVHKLTGLPIVTTRRLWMKNNWVELSKSKFYWTGVPNIIKFFKVGNNSSVWMGSEVSDEILNWQVRGMEWVRGLTLLFILPYFFLQLCIFQFFVECILSIILKPPQYFMSGPICFDSWYLQRSDSAVSCCVGILIWPRVSG